MLKLDMQHLGLIDLISERHQQLRKLAENFWNNNSDISLSNSEWFILARVYQKGQTPISYVTKHVDISRQATHKFIKRLEEKGLILIKQMENNKKEKSIELTDLGKQCYEKNESLKSELESKISDKIGAELVKQLKDILKTDWGW